MKIEEKRSFLLLQLAVMMFGFSGVIRRSVQASSITIAGGRVLCSSCILLTVLLFSKGRLRAKNRRDTAVTVLAGILLAIHWTTFFESIQRGSVAIGTITFSTFPLFLLLMEPLLYHEKMEGKNIFLSIGLMLGVSITIPEFSMTNEVTIAIIWGMICSFTYALLTLCNRKLSGSYSGIWVSFREQSVAALVLLPVLWWKKEPVTRADIGGIIAMGVLCTACAFSLFVTAQRHVSAQTAGISSGMETVYGILFAVVLLKEVPSGREVLGGIIILGIVTLSVILEKKKERSQ